MRTRTRRRRCASHHRFTAKTTAAETTKESTINNDRDSDDGDGDNDNDNHNNSINDSSSMDGGAKKDRRDDDGTARAAPSRSSNIG